MTLRELKYVIYGDDRLSNKLNKISGASKKTNTALGRTSSRIGKAQSKFKSLAGEIPIVGRGMAALTSPAGIAVGAAVAVGAAFNKAIDEAEQFNSTFRELQNMNLEKPVSEIKKLKNEILDMSFDQGFNANKASMGVYDVQSITGLYGKAAESVVAKQGKFAQVMKADFNEWIAGSAKAMANYGFAADELDRFNASAAATIQYGVMTYDQYAKTSSVFAGSAAAAKQSYDSANKLFAVFSKKTKSVDEAATMVKSAFNDLFKAPSIKAFKKIGIDLFDTKGKARQVDQIMKELNARFAKADSDQAMNKLRNEFKGSEGLIALVQAASDQSGDLLRTFEGFDNNKFSFDKAFKGAKEDLSYINDQINNKMKAAWISLGEAVLPFWIDVKKQIVEAMNNISHATRDVMSWFGYGKSNDERKQDKATMSELARYEELNNPEKFTNEQIKEKIALLSQARDKYKDVVDQNQESWKDGWETKKKKTDMRSGAQRSINAINEAIGEMQKVLDTRGKGWKPKPDPETNPDTNPNPDTENNDKVINKGLEAISGGGSRVRNINVEIGKLVETLSIQAATIKEGTAEMRELIQEELMRAVAGFEQTIA